jgi:succinate dehydrogenase / fumarate reductase, flavoprotein subunit
MECIGIDLLQDGGKISGMLAYWRETGRFVVFRAPVVIFATGGAGKAWRVTSNSWEYSGDGYGMAARAGAELLDMEFTQFHPTGMVWPPSVRGTLVTEGVRGEGGILTNSEGVRFMFDNIPERFASETADTREESQLWLDGDRDARRPPELLTRDVVARAIMREVKAGRGSEHGGAYLDISHRDSDFVKRKLPSMYHQFKELAEVDITAEAMEVGPTLHYYMGGIRVDANSQMTNVPGLFAAGECGAGLHGANRLGGNSLSDLIVFGARAGLGAKAYLDKLSGTPTVQQEQVHQQMRSVIDFLNREDGENPYVVVDDLQTTMEQHVGIVREGAELEEGIDKLQKLKERAAAVKAHATSQYNPGWNTCIDLRNMILSAEATARCALQREESRGAHTRLDFEGEREEGLTFNSVVKLVDGQIEARKEMRPTPPEELAKIANASLEELEGNRV